MSKLKHPDRYYWPYDNPKENTDLTKYGQNTDLTKYGQLLAEIQKFGGIDKQRATELVNIIMPFTEKLVHQARVDELERITGYSDIKWFGYYREERLAELKELESKEESI